MPELRFILNKSIPIEETRHYEFKEIKGKNPLKSITNTADEYVVAFLNSEGGRIYWGIRDSDRAIIGVCLSFEERDKLRRLVTEKLMNIQPAIAPSAYRVILHKIYENEETDTPISDMFVVEIVVPRVFTDELYFTGGNEAFVKTDAGKKKLSGPEINDELRRRLSDDKTDNSMANYQKHNETIEGFAIFLHKIRKINCSHAEEAFSRVDMLELVDKTAQLSFDRIVDVLERLYMIDYTKTRQILAHLDVSSLVEKANQLKPLTVFNALDKLMKIDPAISKQIYNGLDSNLLNYFKL